MSRLAAGQPSLTTPGLAAAVPAARFCSPRQAARAVLEALAHLAAERAWPGFASAGARVAGRAGQRSIRAKTVPLGGRPALVPAAIIGAASLAPVAGAVAGAGRTSAGIA